MRFQMDDDKALIGWEITMNIPAYIENSKKQFLNEYADVLAWTQQCIPQSVQVWNVSKCIAMEGIPLSADLVMVLLFVIFHDERDAFAFKLRWQ